MNLTVQNAGFAFKKGVPVIKDLSFCASSGELIAVLGPNGSGKTTLLRCLTGLLRWDTGRTLLDGNDLKEMSSKAVWDRIAYVPQARGSVVSLSAKEMILLGRTGKIGLFSTPGKQDREAAERIAEELGITHLLEKPCNEMSGGELQMILIARALISEPELLILDEPESNLDFKNQIIVLDTLTKLAKAGICCIFNTHYPAHALARADRSLLLGKGGDNRFGKTAEIVTEENIRAFFGVDALISTVSQDGTVYHSILPIRLTQNQ